MSILTQLDEYNYWRDQKLANAHTQLKDCWLEIKNPLALQKSEKNKIQTLCQQNNFALFKIKPQSDYPQAIVAINQQLGLLDFDQHLYAKSTGLAYISQSKNHQQAEFIPYTNKALGWHTDGYYNPADKRIRAFSLFCVQRAKTGGQNQWIDMQMVYLLLRQQNPAIAKALTHNKAMTIPEHKIDGVVRRAKSVGAIFFIDKKSNTLCMRYSQRKTNISLFNSAQIQQAVTHLDDLLASTTKHHFEHLMQAGEGMICNNIIHKRSAFIDHTDHFTPPRLLLRGRYFNRIGL